jgi:hypothetical protein
MAASQTSTQRRGVLAGIALLSTGIAAPVPRNPDAMLIAACDRLRAVDAELLLLERQGVPANLLSLDAAWDGQVEAASDAWDDAMRVVADTPAVTPAGLRAKADAVLAAFRREAAHMPHETGPHEWLAYRLAEDAGRVLA